MPGGEQAIQEPRRVALSLLHGLGAGLVSDPAVLRLFTEDEQSLLLSMLGGGVNSPRCSSVGRLFDGVAALLFAHSCNDYKGETAMLLEQLAVRCENIAALTPWPVPLDRGSVPWQLDWRPALKSLLEERGTVAPAILAARFRVTLAHAILALARETSCTEILLSVVAIVR